MKRFGLRRTQGQTAIFRKTPRFLLAKTWLAGLILFIIGLLLGLALAFPPLSLEERLIKQVEARSQVKIETEGLELGLPFNLHGKQTDIRVDSPGWPLIRIDSFDLSPLWRSLFSTNQGVRWNGRMMNGQLLADIYRDGTLLVTTDNLMLDVPILENSNMHLTGRLTQGKVESVLPLQKQTASSVQLTLDNVMLTGLSGLQNGLNLGTIVLRVTGRGNTFRINTLTATDGDFILNGTGNFLLGRNAASSRLNVRAEIRPDQDLDPTLISLLELAARKNADGAYELRISGSLSTPTLK